MFGWDFEDDAWSRFWRWNLMKICVWTCDKNSTLGSVVPLAMFLFKNKWSYFAFSFWSQIFPFSIFIPRGVLLQSPMPCVDLAAFALMLVSGCGRWETAEIRTMEERRVLVWLCLCLLQCGRNTAGVSICSLVLWVFSPGVMSQATCASCCQYWEESTWRKEAETIHTMSN